MGAGRGIGPGIGHIHAAVGQHHGGGDFGDQFSARSCQLANAAGSGGSDRGAGKCGGEEGEREEEGGGGYQTKYM